MDATSGRITGVGSKWVVIFAFAVVWRSRASSCGACITFGAGNAVIAGNGVGRMRTCSVNACIIGAGIAVVTMCRFRRMHAAYGRIAGIGGADIFVVTANRFMDALSGFGVA